MHESKCSRCNRPSVVCHITIKDGVEEEILLCEAHALEAGLLEGASITLLPTKCDVCERPALVHEVTVAEGVTKESHLCAEHQGQRG
jgi:hypothetical protein